MPVLEFRPISFMRSMYKIIARALSIKLIKLRRVVGSVVSKTQNVLTKIGYLSGCEWVCGGLGEIWSAKGDLQTRR